MKTNKGELMNEIEREIAQLTAGEGILNKIIKRVVKLELQLDSAQQDIAELQEEVYGE